MNQQMSIQQIRGKIIYRMKNLKRVKKGSQSSPDSNYPSNSS